MNPRPRLEILGPALAGLVALGALAGCAFEPYPVLPCMKPGAAPCREVPRAPAKAAAAAKEAAKETAKEMPAGAAIETTKEGATAPKEGATAPLEEVTKEGAAPPKETPKEGAAAPKDAVKGPAIPAAPRSATERAKAAIEGVIEHVPILSVVDRLTPSFHPYREEICMRDDLSACLVERLSIKNNHAISSDAIAEKIATVQTGRAISGGLSSVPIFSIWDRLTVSKHRFDPFVLERDLARVERYYRARGYYEAHARAGRVSRIGPGEVAVEIAVEEGEPVRLASVTVEWASTGPEKFRVLIPVEAARRTLTVGAVFEEAPFEDTKKLLLRAMTDRGFAYAKVGSHSTVDLSKHEARVVYELELGPHCEFGAIRIEGQGELPTAPLLAALGIEPKQEFSTAALEAAEIALADFGVFGSVDVLPELSTGPTRSATVPVLFRVHPAALRSVRVGGGIELGSRIEIHGLTNWENKNFFGGLRRFTVEGKPGFVFYPKSFNTLFSSEKVHVLPEFKSHFELQQPGFLEARTVGIIGGSFNHYRLLTSSATTDKVTLISPCTVEGGVVLPFCTQASDLFVVGYNEVIGVLGVRRPFWKSRVNLGLFAHFQLESPFAYIADAPPAGYKTLIIPYAQLTASLDLRFDKDGKRTKVSPHSGVYIGVDLQGALGSDVRDVRLLPEVRGYIPLPRAMTIALRLSVGLLFPSYGFVDPTYCGRNDDQPASERATRDIVCGRELQISQFRAFFSGGPSSNRGYPYNGVGPHDRVSSQSPDLIATGGNRLWEASAELRVPITEKFGAAVFVDASDVSRDAFRLSEPHLSTGLGIRYDTPVGPLRADLGFRVPCMQKVGRCEPVYDDVASKASEFRPGDYLSSSVGQAGPTFGLPMTVAITIGEAF